MEFYSALLLKKRRKTILNLYWYHFGASSLAPKSMAVGKYGLPRLRSNVLAIRFITGQLLSQGSFQAGYLYALSEPKGKEEAVQVIYISCKCQKWFNSITRLSWMAGGIILTPARGDAQKVAASQNLQMISLLLNPAVGNIPWTLVKKTEERVMESYQVQAHSRRSEVDFLELYHQSVRRQSEGVQNMMQTNTSRVWMNSPYRGWEALRKPFMTLQWLWKEEYGNIPWFISENRWCWKRRTIHWKIGHWCARVEFWRTSNMAISDWRR